MKLWVVLCVGYLPFITGVLAETRCEYLYKDNNGVKQTSWQYCSTDCCGTKENRTCCESQTGYIIGAAIGGVVVFILFFGIILCCCKKSSQKRVRRIAIRNADGQISYISEPATISLDDDDEERAARQHRQRLRQQRRDEEMLAQLNSPFMIPRPTYPDEPPPAYAPPPYKP